MRGIIHIHIIKINRFNNHTIFKILILCIISIVIIMIVYKYDESMIANRV